MKLNCATKLATNLGRPHRAPVDFLWILLAAAALVGCATTAEPVIIEKPEVRALEDAGPLPPPPLKLTWPVTQGRITDIFGRKRGARTHKGMDIARETLTPIFAAEAGKVVYRGYEPGYGNYIELRHRDGWISRYAHLKKYRASWSQYVEKGQLLGLMGRSGRATGTHLHFEVRRYGVPVDPLSLLPRPENAYIPEGFGSASVVGRRMTPVQSIRTEALEGPIRWYR